MIRIYQEIVWKDKENWESKLLTSIYNSQCYSYIEIGDIYSLNR